LQHFGGNPSYRPTFRSKWYLSLLGSIACLIVMYSMSPGYTFVSIIAMTTIYLGLKFSRGEDDDLSTMVRDVLFQTTRRLQILIQRKQAEGTQLTWRPSFIAISADSFTRLAPFDLLRWISHYHGFGTFIHFIEGQLKADTNAESKLRLEQLISQSKASSAAIYVDTSISPSLRTAVAQTVQIPGISGLDNNSVLFEFARDDQSEIVHVTEGCEFASAVDYNICVLRSSERHFGYKRAIHVWLTPGDYRNANLMILLAYIIMGHPEWQGAEITLFASFEDTKLEKEIGRLNRLIDAGRIPISRQNVQRIPWNRQKASFANIVIEHSSEADLVLMGFSVTKAIADKGEYFKSYPQINDLLFVRAGQRIAISDEGK
jgi:hypothetical protein